MKKQIRHLLSVFVVAGTVSFVAKPALAEVVTHNFMGAITFVSGTPFGLSPSIGQQVQGSFTCDTSLPPAFDTGSIAGYIQPPPSGMSVVISGVTLQSQTNNSFQVQNNNFGSDGINGFFKSISVGGVPTSGTMNFNLSDSTATAFSSTALPSSLNIASFNLRTGGVFDGSATIFFSIDTLTLPAIAVTIDVKPGTFPNSINPNGQGVTPVAILTTNPSDNVATFDAANVDPATVLFGSTGTEAAPVHDALEDVDEDGDTDMILHFNIQDTGIQCGDTSATLTGATFDGQAIKGTDSIMTVGCH